MVYEERHFYKIPKHLVSDSFRKVFLIVDNLRVHHSRPVEAWLSRKDVADKIELFHLPS